MSREDLKRNENFNSSESEWQQIVTDALFNTGSRKDDIQISAQRQLKTKKGSKPSVEVHIERLLKDEDLTV